MTSCLCPACKQQELRFNPENFSMRGMQLKCPGCLGTVASKIISFNIDDPTTYTVYSYAPNPYLPDGVGEAEIRQKLEHCPLAKDVLTNWQNTLCPDCGRFLKRARTECPRAICECGGIFAISSLNPLQIGDRVGTLRIKHIKKAHIENLPLLI